MTDFPNPKWLDIIISTAVPFFFVSSGLLMGNHAGESDDSSSYFRNKAVKFIRLWIIWLLIYLPVDMLFHRPYISLEWMINWIQHAILYGEGTYSWPLWFIFSMIIGCLLLSVATHKRMILGTVIVFALSSLLYIVITTAPTDYSICIDILGHKITLPTINKGFARALLGPICVSAGITINWLRLKPTSIRPVIFFAVLLIVTGCIMGYHDIALAILPRSIGVVLIAVLLPQVKINSSSLRQQSMWIYYSHMYCLVVLMFLMIHLQFPVAIYDSAAFILSMTAGWVLTRISNTVRFKFLRVLIS